MLQRRLRVGRFFGIGLYLHWSLMLMVAYVVAITASGGIQEIFWGMTQLGGMFVCVTLHEYGHALAARALGIGTADITLLAIGGLARLKRLPRIPMHELIVAVAGPAVNVVIVAGLLGVLWVIDGDLWRRVQTIVASVVWDPDNPAAMAAASETFDVMSTGGPLAFLLVMLVVNTALVIFNFIPAFPMDGGRVLRSILAMILDYRVATRLASRLGLFLAMGMGVLALSTWPPALVPLGIAVFIAYAGNMEARHVEMTERVRGIVAADVVVPMNEGISMDASLDEIMARWTTSAWARLPVVAVDNIVVGSIDLASVAAASTQGSTTIASELIDRERDPGSIRASEPLEDVLPSLAKDYRQLPVVDDGGRLVGMLDLDTMLARHRLRASQHSVLDREA